MKAQLKAQLRNSNLKRKPTLHQAARVTICKEQVASTSTSTEQTWLMLALALVMLTMGLYWFNDQQPDQPGGSDETLVADQTVVERPADVVAGDPILSEGGDPTSPWPKNLGTPQPVPVSGQNERLVRQFYDEVINQHQFALLDELFADQVAYGRNGPMMILNRTALQQQILAESDYHAGLTYAIEQVTTRRDWVDVDWTAQGSPPIPLTEYPPTGEPEVWSGHTVWQVADGKIAQMWTYATTRPRPYLTDDNEEWQSGQLQDSQDVMEY